MVLKTEHPTEGSPKESELTVTADEFSAVDIEAPIHGTNRVDCWSLAGLYRSAATKQRKEGGDDIAARVYGLLADITNIHFKPKDSSEPYGPQVVMDGKRSVIPSDLKGAQSALLGELVPSIRNPGLRARLADIAWYNNRTLGAVAQHAIEAYREGVNLVLRGEARFFDGTKSPSSRDGSNMLRRACQIANATGWKDPEASRLRELIRAVIQNAFEHRNHRGFLSVARIGLDFRIDVAATIAANAETLADAEDIDPRWSHDLWVLAANAHRVSGADNERIRCFISAAECHVKIADSSGGKGMVAASSLMQAIEELRRLPNTGERRAELKMMLSDAQSDVSDEFGTISTEVDLTDIVDQVRKSASGVSLTRALREFATLTKSPDPDALRTEALSLAERFPLSNMMPLSVIDKEGKVVSKSVGLLEEGEEAEDALRYLIVRNEDHRRQLIVSGLIEPARQLIQSEHPIEVRDLQLLVELSPFVPPDRTEIFARGFARFFGGDFISALHILVPQLENSLRFILKQAGVEPSAIQSDMTQENRTLSVMLNKDRDALEEVFGPSIVYEIENLFDYRGGPSVRHALAHGLVTAAECEGTDSIYACWFMFHLCCLPLLAQWEEVTLRVTP